MSAIQLSPLASITTGFLVLFVGKRLNLEWNFLQRYSIPEPVSGGLLVALLLTVLHVVGGPELLFSLESRDFLLVYFFTAVGIPFLPPPLGLSVIVVVPSWFGSEENVVWS